MLEIRPTCENCNKSLPNESEEAMICTFECTYCKGCVDSVLFNVCPNCSGGFEKRPIRPAAMLIKYPASNQQIFKPTDQEKFESILKKYKNIEPKQR